MTQQEVLADHALARRLERAEACACASFVEQRAIAYPDSRSEWIDVAGAYAMFAGVTSPITQSFGLGMFEPPTAAHMDALECFFRDRGSDPLHEVSPLADRSVPGLLCRRGYEPFEFTSVMFLPLQARGSIARRPTDPGLLCRVIRDEEAEAWAQLSARGWSEFADFTDAIVEYARLNAAVKGNVSFVAEWNGEPIATGGLSIHNGVALLAGASTVPEARKRGAQGALLHARLDHAAALGCDLAMMGAEPGSASQRNAERHGFRIAYTRMKWRPIKI